MPPSMSTQRERMNTQRNRWYIRFWNLLDIDNFVKSDRMLAKELGCTHKTIGAIRNEIITLLKTGKCCLAFDDPMLFIYFIQGEVTKLIKIGKTKRHPSSRLSQLQTGSPDKLKLLKSIRASEDDEEHLHEKFKDYRSHGEWYYPTPILLKYIDSIEEAGGDIQSQFTLQDLYILRGKEHVDQLQQIVDREKYLALDGKYYKRKI